MENKDKFWLEEPSILYKKYNIFFPYPSMTKEEQLNAITRLCIYVLILMMLLGTSDIWIQTPIIIIIIIVIFNLVTKNNTEPKQTNDSEQYAISENKTPTKIPKVTFIDDNGQYNEKKGAYRKKNRHNLATMENYKKNTCRKPTVDNPYMNPTINDTLLADVPEPCNADDEEIKNDINVKFDTELYKDTGDLFDIKNSQRQFYTVPTPSNPPDTVALAEWLYGNKPSCKSSQSACYNYQNLISRQTPRL